VYDYYSGALDAGIFDEFELENSPTHNEEIPVLALEVQPISAEFGIEMWFAPTEEFCVLVLKLDLSVKNKG